MLSNEVFTTEAWYKREHFDGLADPTDPTPVLKAFKVSRRFSDNSAKRTKSLKYPSPDRNSEAPSTKLLNIFRGKYSKSGSETERRKQSMSMSEETERIKAILGQDSHRPRSHSELPVSLNRYSALLNRYVSYTSAKILYIKKGVTFWSSDSFGNDRYYTHVV